MRAWIFCRVCARVALYNGDYPRAEQELQQAIGLQEAALPAWEGKAMLQQARGDTLEAAETYEKLVRASCQSPVIPDTPRAFMVLSAGVVAGCVACRAQWLLLRAALP